MFVNVKRLIVVFSYATKIKKMSDIYHHQQIPLNEQVLHWVQHVIVTKGAMHLRSPALNVAWYQKWYIDFNVLLLAIVFITYNIFVQSTIFTSADNEDSSSEISEAE